MSVIEELEVPIKSSTYNMMAFSYLQHILILTRHISPTGWHIVALGHWIGQHRLKGTHLDTNSTAWGLEDKTRVQKIAFFVSLSVSTWYTCLQSRQQLLLCFSSHGDSICLSGTSNLKWLKFFLSIIWSSVTSEMNHMFLYDLSTCHLPLQDWW